MLTETTFLLLLRTGLFFSCRKYLLRSLYSDLQELSSVSSEDASIPLETLPAPSTHETRNDVAQNSLHSFLSRTIFSLCFSESSLMFLLLMFQGFDILDPSSRLLNWKISMYLLVLTVLLLVPSSVALILNVGLTASYPRVLLSLVVVGIWLIAFSRIPLPEALVVADTLSAAISRLIVAGTIVLGLLSGFGSVSSIWAFLPPRRRDVTQPTSGDVVASESSLARVREDLHKRRSDLRRREGSQAESSWFARVGSNFTGDETQQEVQGLEALEYEMNRNVSNLHHQIDDFRFSGTFKGRVYLLCGKAFALYCYFRVCSSTLNALLPGLSSPSSTNYPDLVTQIVAYLLSRINPEIDTEMVAAVGRTVSLVLVGVIILSSIRLVLVRVTRLLRVTSRNLGASLMLLVLAQLMSIYLLSTVVQLRTSFPPPPADNASNLFLTIPEFQVFGLLFNWTFLLGAVPTGILLWIADRVRDD